MYINKIFILAFLVGCVMFSGFIYIKTDPTTGPIHVQNDDKTNFANAIDPVTNMSKPHKPKTTQPAGHFDMSVATNIEQAWLSLPALSSNCLETDAFDYGLETRVGALLLYCYFSNIIDYRVVEQIAGMQVFISGPHKNGKLNLNATHSFGHYNPEFIKWFIEKSLPLDNFATNDLAMNIYKQHLSHLLPIYLAVKFKLNANPDFYTEQVMFIKQMPHPDSYPESPMYRYAEFIKMTQPDYAQTFINEATTFWLRRRIDGTDHLFQEAVENFIQVWDPQAYTSLLQKDWVMYSNTIEE